MFGVFCLKCGSKDIQIKKDTYIISNYDSEYIDTIVCKNCNNELDFDRLLIAVENKVKSK